MSRRRVAITGLGVVSDIGLDVATALDTYRRVYGLINDGRILSAHDCSDGGLGVALAEAGTALGGRVTRERLLPGLSAWGRVAVMTTSIISATAS